MKCLFQPIPWIVKSLFLSSGRILADATSTSVVKNINNLHILPHQETVEKAWTRRSEEHNHMPPFSPKSPVKIYSEIFSSENMVINDELMAEKRKNKKIRISWVTVCLKCSPLPFSLFSLVCSSSSSPYGLLLPAVPQQGCSEKDNVILDPFLLSSLPQ